MALTKLKILQVNLGHRRVAYADLELEIKNNNIDIAAIQETPRCREYKLPTIHGYEFIGNRNVAFYIKKEFPLTTD